MGDDTLDKSSVLLYYKQKSIQEAITGHAKDKEVAGSYGGKGYAKRPDVLRYPADVLEFVKQGVTSFHASEELWEDPLLLQPGMRKTELDTNRKGWDLLLDIDCKELEFSKMAGHLLVHAIKFMGVKSVSVKFSGNHGFHIGVPFEAFPAEVNGVGIKDLFPDAAKRIALFLADTIRAHLAAMMLERWGLDKIASKVNKEINEILKDGKFDPFLVLDIDTVLITSRHLYRMPYSFNEKSGLVSLPIHPDSILTFNKNNANWHNVRVNEFVFMDRSNVEPGEAKRLIVQAFDHKAENNIIVAEEDIKEYEIPEEAIAEEHFPPCVKKALNGLADGKKRTMFILVNFLRCCGWSYDQIEARLKEWNKANPEPLREVILIGQVRYARQHNKKVLPPNCNNKMYYHDFQICIPDNLCSKISNPVNYAQRKVRYIVAEKKKAENEEAKKNMPRLTEEQKEMRRKHREKVKSKDDEDGVNQANRKL